MSCPVTWRSAIPYACVDLKQVRRSYGLTQSTAADYLGFTTRYWQTLERRGEMNLALYLYFQAAVEKRYKRVIPLPESGETLRAHRNRFGFGVGHAALHAGVAERTWYGWEDDDPIIPALSWDIFLNNVFRDEDSDE